MMRFTQLALFACSFVGSDADLGERGAPAAVAAETWESLVRADGGVPVEYDGGTMYLYGDTLSDGGRFHNSSVVLDDGTILLDVLPAAADDGWFWLMDARVMPSGRFLVLASEMRSDPTSWFGFRVVDTDAFVVNDPTNVMSWRLAEHHDDGWWDGHNVRFVPGTHQAAVRPYDDWRTYLFSMETERMGPALKDDEYWDLGSNGVIVPVEHDGAWWTVTWSMGTGRVTIWRSEFREFGYDFENRVVWEYEREQTYGHSLAVIDGKLVHYWSTIGGRVTYQEVV